MLFKNWKHLFELSYQTEPKFFEKMYLEKFWKFFMVLEFHKLKYHGKLDFHKIEFQKSDKLLNILQMIVDSYIFFLTVAYGHFVHPIPLDHSLVILVDWQSIGFKSTTTANYPLSLQVKNIYTLYIFFLLHMFICTYRSQ